MGMPQEPVVNDYEPTPISPLSDPFHAGLIPSPTAALLSPGRGHHGPGHLPDVGPVEGPDVDVRGQLGEVMGDGDSEASSSGAGESAGGAAPVRPAPVNDADHPMARGGIFSGSDGNMHYARPAADGSFSITQVGAPGDGSV
jgi:hypothetical protein